MKQIPIVLPKQRSLREMMDLDPLFWNKVEPKPNGCMIFTGGQDSNGYGKIRRRKLFGSMNVRAHRYSIYLRDGLLPESSVFVCHRCDTPLCVNPDHLFLGSHQDNMDDMNRKKRGFVPPPSVGTQNGNCKLTDDEVKLVREEIAKGTNNKAISRLLNGKISHSMVSRIRLGKSWKMES